MPARDTIIRRSISDIGMASCLNNRRTYSKELLNPFSFDYRITARCYGTSVQWLTRRFSKHEAVSSNLGPDVVPLSIQLDLWSEGYFSSFKIFMYNWCTFRIHVRVQSVHGYRNCCFMLIVSILRKKKSSNYCWFVYQYDHCYRMFRNWSSISQKQYFFKN